VDLHEAASAGDAARVQELLDAGADVDALDRWENTPLLLACFSEVHYPQVVALLRERGADPYRRNIHWDTPRSQAYERYLLSGFDPLADLPAPESPKTEADQLTEDEMAATVAAVRAVIERERPTLEAMGACDHGDPYEFTREYGRWGEVHLVMPPGNPRAWVINVTRADDDEWVVIAVEMWTREEGRSDLTLELELERQPDGRLRSQFHNLHVM
jgi:hypothetical protein